MTTFLGCSAPLPFKYGFLPAKTYPYYPLPDSVNLKQDKLYLSITDGRDKFTTSNCSDIVAERDFELEGEYGIRFLTAYLSFLVNGNSLTQVSDPIDTVHIEVEVLSPKITGFLFITVHGMVQYTVKCQYFTKTYCSDLKDGDPESPLGTFSVDTRLGSSRKMISASVLKVTSEFITDYSRYRSKVKTP